MSSVNTHYQNQVADLLSQIRAHQGEPSSRADLIRSDTSGVGGIGQVTNQAKGNFATYMVDAFNDVNDVQQASAELKNAYERAKTYPSPMSCCLCKRHLSVLKRHCRCATTHSCVRRHHEHAGLTIAVDTGERGLKRKPWQKQH